MTFRLPRISRRALRCADLAPALLAPPGSAFVDADTNKPTTLILPGPPVGSTDRHRRTLAEIASKHLGQSAIVHNQPIGGGTTGPDSMARSGRPHGDTIARFAMDMLRIPHLQKMLWDPLTDFSFILGLPGHTFGFVVRTDSPHKKFTEYVEAPAEGAGPGRLRLHRHRHLAATAARRAVRQHQAGMEPAVLKTLRDAFEKATEGPRHVEVPDQLNQEAWYRSGDEYAAWARSTRAKDRPLIDRLGQAAK